MKLSKEERIQLRKKDIGTKRDRKLEKHSDKFNRMFSFFYQIVRKEICDFCGSDVKREYEIVFDINADSAKLAFKKYENGEIKDFKICTKHPNVLLTVIKGKKGWGLWSKLYSEGIIDGSFTKAEILGEFSNKNIVIPQPYLIEFYNLIYKVKNNNYDPFII